MTFTVSKLNLLKCATLAIFAAVLMIGTGIQAQSEVMTAEHIAALNRVYDMAISPDGESIAYIRYVPRDPFKEKDGEAWRRLYVSDLEGNSKPYVTGDVRVSSVKFTPDGSLISYLAERGEDTVKSLYVIPVDGGESRRIIEFETSIKEYSWAPDSRTVAFIAKEAMPEETCKLHDKGFDQDVYEEDIRDNRVWIFDSGLETDKPRLIELEGTASSLYWSSEGSMLAIAVAPTSLIDDKYMKRKVHFINPETGEIIQKFENPGKLGSFAWSPDGANLAIISGADINDPAAGEILLCSAESGSISQVLTGIDGHVSRIAWTDKNTILYIIDQGVHTAIATIKKDGSKQKDVVPLSTPVFRKLSVSTDGKTAALIGNAANHDSELFALKLKDKKPVRLTDSNPWLKNIRLAPQEVVRFKARDGLELEGILIHPLDKVEGQRYPLILQVHGGPEAHRRDGWLTWYSSPGQMAAAKGFAVFVINYRGSTGHGVEFSKMGQGGYAESEFNDLVDAVEHLVNIGLVDRDRVGVTGGSYGGFASAWCATALSEHFAASVMGFGVSDLISKFGTTDIPNEMYLVHARSWPWERWQWYLEQSPIYHVQKAKTPILILHGEDDTRVHPSQSMELYRYLKTKGDVPVRMVFYKDEGHGMGKAAARYDYSMRQMRWMEYYLLEGGTDMPPSGLDYSKMQGGSK